MIEDEASNPALYVPCLDMIIILNLSVDNFKIYHQQINS